jgi:predicted HicB family RNase H-like nuclease
MSNMLEYKGYHTNIEYSAEDDCLIGKLLGINDLVLFHAQSLKEFRKAFHVSVDDYIEYCLANGKEPEKEYSGHFNVRISPSLHRAIAVKAEQQGKKLNTLISEVLEHAFS